MRGRKREHVLSRFDDPLKLTSHPRDLLSGSNLPPAQNNTRPFVLIITTPTMDDPKTFLAHQILTEEKVVS